MSGLRVFLASAILEIEHLRRNLSFVFLTVMAAISFLVMISLFGLTGSNAPVALIDMDQGIYAQRFVQALRDAHHSFDLKSMSKDDASRSLRSGQLAGIITIPAGFTADVERGTTVPVQIQIDNVNVDLTNDMQRALPAAIVSFGRSLGFPGVRVSMVEHDVIPHDTGYIPYLAVSALALAAMVIAGALGALATAREFESGTVRVLRLTPAPLGFVLAGKLSVATAVAALAMAVTVLSMILFYGVIPVSPLATLLALGACVAIFTCMGAWLGTSVQRTLSAVPFLFGLAMPFYIDSGALEPTRFDGETIWRMAHLSPVYYAVGVLEWSFHGLHVTPEPVYLDLIVLLTIAAIAVGLTVLKLSKGRAR